MDYQEIHTKIEDYKESEEDKNYNRYFIKTKDLIVDETVRKIINFGEICLVYTKESLNEAIMKWQMKNKRINF